MVMLGLCGSLPVRYRAAACHTGRHFSSSVLKDVYKRQQPSVLWAICLFGQLLAETGDTTPALALYGLVRAQPALDNQLRVEIDEEIARMGLPAAAVAAGLAAGAELDLGTVVGEILNGQW